MATENTKDGVSFICDCCGDEWCPPRPPVGFPPRDFQECLELVKEEGWRAVKVRSKVPGKDIWEHRCQECV